MTEDFFPEFDDILEEGGDTIQFFSEETDFNLGNQAAISDWIKKIISKETVKFMI